jgi:hypothetical protein
MVATYEEGRPYHSPYVTARHARLHREALARPPDHTGPVYEGEPEPKLGEWKLAVGIFLLLLVIIGAFLSLIGLSFITWYLKDLHAWRAWARRVHSDRH